MDKTKISFGFSKTAKKPALISNNQNTKEVKKIELIKCLEGQEIKLVEEKKELAPLIIPLKSKQKTSAALASLMKRRAVLLGEDEEDNEKEQESAENMNDDTANGDCDTLEKRAARELLAELKSKEKNTENTNMVVPILKPDELPLDGAKESSLDDYESIPIEQFGIAMLRGMGWVAPPKKSTSGSMDKGPIMRPKGMGLGADKALKAKPLLIPPETNEVLEIKKNAYIRILGGKFKDLYGQIEGFDDHAGRVIVKMAVGGTKEAFNEFLCQPVSKKEFLEYGRCINTNEYKKLKEMENINSIATVKQEPNAKSSTTKDKFESKYNEKIKEETNYDEDIKLHKEKKAKMEKYESTTYKYDSFDRTSPDSRSLHKYKYDYRSHRDNRSRSRSPHNSHDNKRSNCSEVRQNIRRKFELSDESTQSNDSIEYKKHKKSKTKSKKSKKKKDNRRYTSSDESSSHKNDARHSKSTKTHKKSKKSRRERSRSGSRSKR